MEIKDTKDDLKKKKGGGRAESTKVLLLAIVTKYISPNLVA